LHVFFFSSRRRHTRWPRDWSSAVCSSDLPGVVDLDLVRMGEDPPVPRLMLAHSDEVEIHDTWDAMGLRGTGSHDIEMSDVFVPEIGRASCRERGEIAVGGVDGEKKQMWKI